MNTTEPPLITAYFQHALDTLRARLPGSLYITARASLQPGDVMKLRWVVSHNGLDEWTGNTLEDAIKRCLEDLPPVTDHVPF
jgi:hypothetical protein